MALVFVESKYYVYVPSLRMCPCYLNKIAVILVAIVLKNKHQLIRAITVLVNCFALIFRDILRLTV